MHVALTSQRSTALAVVFSRGQTVIQLNYNFRQSNRKEFLSWQQVHWCRHVSIRR